MNTKNIKQLIYCYRNNPQKFVEEIYGIRLSTYQKVMFNVITKARCKYDSFCCLRRQKFCNRKRQ